jgi:hypothetical protein
MTIDGRRLRCRWEGPDDPIAAAVDAMITVRSGGAVMEADEAVSRLEKAGLRNVEEVVRTWRAPVRLVVARKGAETRTSSGAGAEA